MSYDVSLLCTCCGNPLHSEVHRQDGGTYILGGTGACRLNVTYNYSDQFKPHFDGGLWLLDGKSASEMIPVLEHAVTELGTERALDYWEPTPGNAGYALSILLGWAQEHPEGKFEVE